MYAFFPFKHHDTIKITIIEVINYYLLLMNYYFIIIHYEIT